MWLKVYYPSYFMAAVLTSWMGAKTELLVPYLNECRRMNIKVLPPDINQSSSMFEVSKNEKGIHFGLNAVKGVGTKAVDNILELKVTHAIKNLSDFISLTNSSVNKTVVTSLIQAGAFDFLELNRKTMVQMAEELIVINSKIKQKITNNKKRKNPVSDISSFYNPLYDYEAPTDVKEYTTEELCELERQLTGFYMAHHPLDGYIDFIRAKSMYTSTEINFGRLAEFDPSGYTEEEIAELEEAGAEFQDDEVYIPLPKGQTIITGGYVKQVTLIQIKNGKSKGKQMASFILEDAYQGDIKCTMFAETYAKFRNTIHNGNVIFIKGNLDYYREDAQVNVKDVKAVDREVASRYVVDHSAILAEVLEQIKLSEETIEIIGIDDLDMISTICEELILLYERKNEIENLINKDVVA